MSELVWTATFVRLGRSPFGSKPKEATVFAQRLEGGSALTRFTNLDDPSIDLRIRGNALEPSRLLMAGFAVAEPRVPLEGDPQLVAARMRTQAADGEVELTAADAEGLAHAVEDLDLSLFITSMGTGVDLSAASFGAWVVQVVPV